jgi:hypothetical protein
MGTALSETTVFFNNRFSPFPHYNMAQELLVWYISKKKYVLEGHMQNNSISGAIFFAINCCIGSA